MAAFPWSWSGTKAPSAVKPTEVLGGRRCQRENFTTTKISFPEYRWQSSSLFKLHFWGWQPIRFPLVTPAGSGIVRFVLPKRLSFLRHLQLRWLKPGQHQPIAPRACHHFQSSKAHWIKALRKRNICQAIPHD